MGLSISLWRAHPPNGMGVCTFGQGHILGESESILWHNFRQLLSLFTPLSRSLSSCVCLCAQACNIGERFIDVFTHTHMRSAAHWLISSPTQIRAEICALHYNRTPIPWQDIPCHAIPYHSHPSRKTPCWRDCTALILLKCHFDWLWCVWMDGWMDGWASNDLMLLNVLCRCADSSPWFHWCD